MPTFESKKPRSDAPTEPPDAVETVPDFQMVKSKTIKKVVSKLEDDEQRKWCPSCGGYEQATWDNDADVYRFPCGGTMSVDAG